MKPFFPPTFTFSYFPLRWRTTTKEMAAKKEFGYSALVIEPKLLHLSFNATATSRFVVVAKTN